MDYATEYLTAQAHHGRQQCLTLLDRTSDLAHWVTVLSHTIDAKLSAASPTVVKAALKSHAKPERGLKRLSHPGDAEELRRLLLKRSRRYSRVS
jgi:hypothetical protein